jgi:hypothetical protein
MLEGFGGNLVVQVTKNNLPVTDPEDTKEEKKEPENNLAVRDSKVVWVLCDPFRVGIGRGLRCK